MHRQNYAAIVLILDDKKKQAMHIRRMLVAEQMAELATWLLACLMGDTRQVNKQEEEASSMVVALLHSLAHQPVTTYY
jgi:muramoyltetrapeptide carboxypeptidase LdcA involved in peptidoglycan recycling